MTTTTAQPALQPQPDHVAQAVAYLAFPENDIQLSHLIGPARKVLGCEGVAYAFSHGQPGVKPVLVVLATQEPHLPDVEFRRAQ
jgi:hypothetical protein